MNKFKAPHKAIQSPLGHAVPIKGTSVHWCYTPPKGRRKRNTVQPSLVTITRDFYTGEFVVRRASADKTVMVAKPTKQEAETAAFQMGYRIVKSGKGTRELSGAPE